MAESLLGHELSCVLTERCYRIVRGRDLFGNRFCDRICPLVNMVRNREPVRPFELDLLNASKRRHRQRG